MIEFKYTAEKDYPLEKFHDNFKGYAHGTSSTNDTPFAIYPSHVSGYRFEEGVPSEDYPDTTFCGPKLWEQNEVVELLKATASNKVDKSKKIEVKLVSGITLYISPCYMEPRRVILSKRKAELKDDVMSRYGKLGYSLSEKIEKGDYEPLLGEGEDLEFILLAISASYDLPLDIINHLNIISSQDLDPIYCAGLGIIYDELKKNSV